MHYGIIFKSCKKNTIYYNEVCYRKTNKESVLSADVGPPETNIINRSKCNMSSYIIPIPKGSKASLTSSDKYRSIAISSVIGKILDHVIIDRLSDCLKTSDYQFGFKSNSSTVLCSTMVNETIQYYIEKGGKRIYVLLLDATKAFDKVSYKVLFDILLKKKMYALELLTYYITCIVTNYAM